MYAICSTKKGHVKEHVNEMRANGWQYRVFQFSKKIYADLDKNRDKVPTAVGRRFARHAITIHNGMLHRLFCKKLVEGKYVSAAITRPSLTGLKKCSCMK